MRCPTCYKPESRHSANCVRRVFASPAQTIENKPDKQTARKILSRIIICLGVVMTVIGGFYLSLIVSADALAAEDSAKIDEAIQIIEKSGFTAEAFYLRNFAVYRGSDNWLNSTVAKENAYAATNFPFAIITVYPDFFSYTKDDRERAAILLHEAIHLKGGDEMEAYSFVWKRKKELGWTKENYSDSIVWQEIRKQTAEYVPNLFVCDFNDFNDCSE